MIPKVLGLPLLVLAVGVLVTMPNVRHVSQAAPTADPQVTVELSAGWNVFSYLGETKPVAEALDQIDGNYRTVWQLHAPNQSWLGYDTNVPPSLNELTELTQYKAYLIYMTSDDSLAFDIGPVPTTPILQPQPANDPCRQTLFSGRDATGSLGSDGTPDAFHILVAGAWPQALNSHAVIIDPAAVPPIVSPLPYDFIAGTKYIGPFKEGWDPSNTALGWNVVATYRTAFTLPANFTGASLNGLIHADNVASVRLNGGAAIATPQPFQNSASNFKNPPESFTFNSGFQPGTNTLDFDIFNFSNISAFDYRAEVTCSAPTPTPSPTASPTPTPTPIEGPCDLTITKNSSPGVPGLGTITYTLRVDWLCPPLSGSNTPTVVHLDDALPLQPPIVNQQPYVYTPNGAPIVTFTSATSGQVGCSGPPHPHPGAPGFDTNRFSCDLGILPPNGYATVSVSIDTGGGQNLANTAVVDTDNLITESNEGNNQAQKTDLNCC